MAEPARTVVLWEAEDSLKILALIQAGYRIQASDVAIQVIVGTEVIREYHPGDHIPEPEELRRCLAQHCRKVRLREGSIFRNRFGAGTFCVERVEGSRVILKDRRQGSSQEIEVHCSAIEPVESN